MYNYMEKKLKEVEQLLNEKIEEYQGLENNKNNLAQEIIKLRGQLELLQELCQHKKKQ